MDYTFAALNCVSTKMFYFVGNWHEEAFQEIKEEEARRHIAFIRKLISYLTEHQSAKQFVLQDFRVRVRVYKEAETFPNFSYFCQHDNCILFSGMMNYRIRGTGDSIGGARHLRRPYFCV